MSAVAPLSRLRQDYCPREDSYAVGQEVQRAKVRYITSEYGNQGPPSHIRSDRISTRRKSLPALDYRECFRLHLLPAILARHSGQREFSQGLGTMLLVTSELSQNAIRHGTFFD